MRLYELRRLYRAHPSVVKANDNRTPFDARAHQGGVPVSLAVRFGDVEQAVHHPEKYGCSVAPRLRPRLDEAVDDVPGQPLARAK